MFLGLSLSTIANRPQYSIMQLQCDVKTTQPSSISRATRPASFLTITMPWVTLCKLRLADQWRQLSACEHTSMFLLAACQFSRQRPIYHEKPRPHEPSLFAAFWGGGATCLSITRAKSNARKWLLSIPIPVE